jgi:membrane protein implicated in regulation of membrane protease activity
VWFVRGLIFLVLLFAMVYFFVTNSGQSVDINLFGKQYLGVSMYWVVVVSFMLGFGTALVLALVREVRLQRDMARLRKLTRDKDRELADLRTLPLRDDGTAALMMKDGDLE